MAEDVTAERALRAGGAGLGTLVSTHAGAPLWPVALRFGVGAAVAAAVLALVPAPQGWRTLVVVLAALAGVAAVVLLVAAGVGAAGRPEPKVVHRFRGGLLVEQDGERHAFAWSEVDAVWFERPGWIADGGRGPVLAVADGLLLRRRDGRLARMRRVTTGAAELRAGVAEGVGAVLVPRFGAALDAGVSVGFGALVLTPAGVGRGRALIPWDRIEGITDSGARIVVRGRGVPPLSARAGDVTNPFALTAVVRARAGTAATPAPGPRPPAAPR